MTPRRASNGGAQQPQAMGLEEAVRGPRLALRKEEAAAALGLSDESFDRYVRPHVPCVVLSQPGSRRSLRLYPVAGLLRWLEENGRVPLEEVA